MNFKHLFAGMFAFAAVLACEPDFVPELNVDPAEVTVASVEGSATINVKANEAWTITTDAEWITANPASGEASAEGVAVTLTAADNMESARTATVTVTSQSGLVATVTVTQDMVPFGTEANPWLIMTAADLVAAHEKIAPRTETWFKLGADIDMKDVQNYVPFYVGEAQLDGDDVVTVVTSRYHFDGNGKTISNLTCASEKYPSLFGILVGTCKNLTIKNAAITATTHGGILAGFVGYEAKAATVTNVSVQGTVNAEINRVGGLAGWASNATFTDCSADVAVTTTSTDAAGFVGYVNGKSAFTNCNVKVALVSKAIEKCRCGGFIGWNRATETTIENCHVLAGSSIVDESNRAAADTPAAKITNFGGFIGFGDSDAEPTKVTVKNSSAKVTINSGDWAQVNSCFVGSFGYAPEVLLENCTAEGDVIAGPNAQNYAGGLIARAQNAGVKDNPAVANITIKNCSYTGNVTGRAGVGGLVGALDNGNLTISGSQAKATVKNFQNNIGGIIGLTAGGTLKVDGCSFEGKVDGVSYVGGVCGGLGTAVTSVEISRTSSAGQVISSNSYAGGIVGAAQAPVQSLANCFSSASVELTGTGKQIGGLVGTATSVISITNSFASGDQISNNVAGGIIGRIAGEGSKVSKCIAWNSSLSSKTKSSTGAIVGSLEKSGEYLSCVRKSDMTVTGTSVALADQDDIKTVEATTAYHGKAAAAGKTASAVAKELGWDETIWDLSKDVPALK